MTRSIKGLAVVLARRSAFDRCSLVTYVSVHLQASYKPSNIVNFHPADFRAKAASPFFHSIGAELKNSDEIHPNAPALLRGKIGNFLVSPDNTKIAVVANGRPKVVWRDGNTREVAPVDSIYESISQ